ncbi:MAG: histidine kinase [Gemmatimonadetes bacterium]|nr:histidine kinase [Gemmatimonadota bacterium]
MMAQVMNGLFLYFILLGFLMWTESVERIQEGRTMVARARMLRAEAEAKALRAQFSPHFVFNALHSMILLIRADPDAAERSVEDMAALIRYGSVLQKRASETVPLAVEAGVAQRYLALEKMRLGDRLECHLEIEPGLDGLAVPALTLQTLLENAVKHGIAPLEEGGSIGLSVAAEGEDLVIRVSDDGAGADPSAIGGEESGLHLLARRLDSIYGERDGAGAGRASLRWETSPKAGFTATVRLPREPAEPMEFAPLHPERSVVS